MAGAGDGDLTRGFAGENAYRRLREKISAGAEVGESDAGLLAPVNEHLVQVIWRDQLLDGAKLRTTSGRAVRVVDPGRWNRESGPDFRAAEVEVGGRILRGDIEIHLDAADWRRHAHDGDFEYNGVVLHVALHATDGGREDTLQNGLKVERVLLEAALDPDLDSIRRAVEADDDASAQADCGASCVAALARHDRAFLRRFFQAAARERIEQKIRRHAAAAESDDPDQALYQSLMTAMGHRGSKTLFYLLSKRVPLAELRMYTKEVAAPDLAAAIEAVLLHTAGLSGPGTPGCESAPLDDESVAYQNRMNSWWARYAGYFEDRLIPPTKRWFAGVRPASFAPRRISGIAEFLARHDFRRGLVERIAAAATARLNPLPRKVSEFRRCVKDLSGMLMDEGNGYWQHRFTLGGKRMERGSQTIGEDLAKSLLFNALLPALVAHARASDNTGLEEALWALHENFPALADNVIVKHMRQRLFGGNPAEIMSMKLEWHSQALIHVYHDCCGNAQRTTGGCLFMGTAP